MSTQDNSIAAVIERVTARFAGADLFYGHGTDNPRDEAAWLVMHVANVSLDGRFDNWGQELSATQLAAVEQLANQRCQSGQPLAYLLGSAWFAGLEFEVTPDVLVPRSPLAELILDAYRPWINPDEGPRILDLCTGSGCIGLATAWHIPLSRVDAADISETALEVAGRNRSKLGLDDRVTLYRSDLLNDLPQTAYDLIVTNPPYVSAESMAGLPDEFLAEPSLGLQSGQDGLDAALAIMLDAPRFLGEYGVLICEVGESEQRLAEALPGVPFLWLEFEHGGSGVFLLERRQLVDAEAEVAALIGKRNSDVA